MTTNTQFKTLMHEWLKAKKPMVAPSTHANFTLIAVNHLIPQFGRMKIGTITEAEVQAYILHLHAHGRLDGRGGLSAKSIHDILLVFRLTMAYAYKLRVFTSARQRRRHPYGRFHCPRSWFARFEDSFRPMVNSIS